MPDLDLIKQAELGYASGSGKVDPSISIGLMKAATNAGDFAADLVQEHHTAGWCFAGWCFNEAL
jgi:hypothetical protein